MLQEEESFIDWLQLFNNELMDSGKYPLTNMKTLPVVANTYETFHKFESAKMVRYWHERFKECVEWEFCEEPSPVKESGD